MAQSLGGLGRAFSFLITFWSAVHVRCTSNRLFLALSSLPLYALAERVAFSSFAADSSLFTATHTDTRRRALTYSCSTKAGSLRNRSVCPCSSAFRTESSPLSSGPISCLSCFSAGSDALT